MKLSEIFLLLRGLAKMKIRINDKITGNGIKITNTDLLKTGFGNYVNHIFFEDAQDLEDLLKLNGYNTFEKSAKKIVCPSHLQRLFNILRHELNIKTKLDKLKHFSILDNFDEKLNKEVILPEEIKLDNLNLLQWFKGLIFYGNLMNEAIINAQSIQRSLTFAKEANDNNLFEKLYEAKYLTKEEYSFISENDNKLYYKYHYYYINPKQERDTDVKTMLLIIDEKGEKNNTELIHFGKNNEQDIFRGKAIFNGNTNTTHIHYNKLQKYQESEISVSNLGISYGNLLEKEGKHFHAVFAASNYTDNIISAGMVIISRINKEEAYHIKSEKDYSIKIDDFVKYRLLGNRIQLNNELERKAIEEFKDDDFIKNFVGDYFAYSLSSTDKNKLNRFPIRIKSGGGIVSMSKNADRKFEFEGKMKYHRANKPDSNIHGSSPEFLESVLRIRTEIENVSKEYAIHYLFSLNNAAQLEDKKFNHLVGIFTYINAKNRAVCGRVLLKKTVELDWKDENNIASFELNKKHDETKNQKDKEDVSIESIVEYFRNSENSLIISPKSSTFNYLKTKKDELPIIDYRKVFFMAACKASEEGDIGNAKDWIKRSIEHGLLIFDEEKLEEELKNSNGLGRIKGEIQVLIQKNINS